MRLHRFYTTEQITGETLRLENEDLIHQWRNVFRYTIGGQVIMFNGDGYDYMCLIAEMYNKTATLQIVNRKKSVMPAKKITLAMALVKKDTFEWITEKATELGVMEIIPLIAERSEKKSLRMDRLEKIAIEASEQSGRGDVPRIHEPVSVKYFLTDGNGTGENFTFNEYTYDQKIIFHVGKNFQKNQSAAVADVDTANTRTLICIGPEGGWSDDEVALFQSHGFEIRSLGDLVLRAETAAIAALSLFCL